MYIQKNTLTYIYIHAHTSRAEWRCAITTRKSWQKKKSGKSVRLVVSRSTRPPLSPSPHANSIVIGTAGINTWCMAMLMYVRMYTHSMYVCVYVCNRYCSNKHTRFYVWPCIYVYTYVHTQYVCVCVCMCVCMEELADFLETQFPSTLNVQSHCREDVWDFFVGLEDQNGLRNIHKKKYLEDKHRPYHDEQHKVHPIPKPHLLMV